MFASVILIAIKATGARVGPTRVDGSDEEPPV